MVREALEELKMDNCSEKAKALQRVATLARHLAPPPPAIAPLHLDPCSSSSYDRIHGDIPSGPASWQTIRLSGPDLQDLLYERAAGEAIAKVLSTLCVCGCLCMRVGARTCG